MYYMMLIHKYKVTHYSVLSVNKKQIKVHRRTYYILDMLHNEQVKETDILILPNLLAFHFVVDYP